MNFTGIAVGVTTFLIIGAFHPIVIKCEYYFTKKIWPVFFILGILSIIGSLNVEHSFFSTVLGTLGCVFLWSILELKEQAERVEKGWFPQNPNRKKK